MTTRNDITGDPIATKPASEAYRARFDQVFAKPTKCARCGKANSADVHTCTPPGDGFGLCDKCDLDNCCRG